jgi:hypothetical protein
LSDKSLRKEEQMRCREPDEVSEIGREHRPDESRKGTVLPSKASQAGEEGIEQLSSPWSVRRLFIVGKTIIQP